MTISDRGVVTTSTSVTLSGLTNATALVSLTVTRTDSLVEVGQGLDIAHPVTPFGGDAVVRIENGGRLNVLAPKTGVVEHVSIGLVGVAGDGVFSTLEVCAGGTLDAPLIEVGPTGALIGSGTVIGSVNSSGVVEPGCSTGQLDLRGDFTQASDGVPVRFPRRIRTPLQFSTKVRSRYVGRVSAATVRR